MEPKFTKPEYKAWGGLLSAHSRMMSVIETDLQQRCGISHIEFEILLRLTFTDGNRLRIQDLAERSILTRSGTSRLVERLEKSGLVSRVKATDDKRGAYAVLTKAGSEKFEIARKGHIALVKEEFLQNYSESELKNLGELLNR